MPVRATPSFLQAGSHPAEETRLMVNALAGGGTGSFAQPLSGGSITARDSAHGIINESDLAVTQNGTPNMSVNVAAGSCFIRGMSSAVQGAYHLVNDGTLNVTISAADATNARRDLIIAVVRDAAYSGASNDARIIVVTGTPAASPSDPSLASFPNALVLARVAVAAGATTITNANITDLRQFALVNGTLPIATSTTIRDIRLASPTDGQGMYLNTNTTTEGPWFYNGTSWRQPWNMPWGNIIQATSTSNTSIGASLATVGISTGSFSTVANRNYRVTVNGVMLATGAALQTVTFELSNGTPAKVVDLTAISVTGTSYYAVTASVPVTSPGSSTVTWTVRAVAGGGGGTVAMRSDVSRGSIIVEDIGPSGAPA